MMYKNYNFKYHFEMSFQGILSILMLTTDNVFQLINYTAFVESLFWEISVLGLLILRWKQPDRERPIKVPNLRVQILKNVFKIIEK